MLAHEPTDLLGVDDDATMAEFGVNAPVAIGLELVQIVFISATMIASRPLGRGCVVKSRAPDPH